MAKKLIEIKNLKKYYRYGIRGLGIQALDGISFDVEEGRVFGLLGPNGAGKSTAIKIILGLTKQNSGDCLIFGEKMSTKLRSQIGYLPEAPYFYKFLTGFELVKFYAKLCGMKNKDADLAAMKAINLVGLDDAANRQIGLYSKGMIQRAGLAQALVHNPKLLILDEPASGLDPIGASDMANIILRLRDEGKTILMCSHIMSEVERLCSEVAILAKGKIVALGNLNELLKIPERKTLEFSNMDTNSAQKLKAYAESLGLKVCAEHDSKVSLDEYFRKAVK